MRALLIGATVVLLTVACGSSKDAPSAKSKQLPTGTIDQILAPIALYPDALLAQILMCAEDPPKVAELDKWLKSNTQLKGTELQDAAVKAGFEPSFVALALFPPVVARMADQIAWTTMLGQAFEKDKTAVFDAIQKLRLQAKNVGTLKSNAQQDVETRKTSSGQDVIVIEPANPQIIYVPQYNTEVVYTQPPATTSTTTVIVQEDDHDAEMAVAAGLIGFTAGVAIGASMSSPYYYGPYGWHGGAYMYNDAWNDYYDYREDARDDWMDHREDIVEERSDRLEDRGSQRTDRRESTADQRTQRQDNRQENRPDSGTQRADRSSTASAGTQRAERSPAAAAGTQRAERSPTAASASTQRTERTGSAEARGYGNSGTSQSARSSTATTQRSSSSRSDAFSGYSSGSSQKAASSRGQASRSSSSASRSRSGGGRGR